jgi:hypothetical protein
MEISLSPQVTLQPTDDGALIFDADGDPVYQLDEVGLRLWQLLAANGDFDSAVTQMLLEYEIEERELRRELRGLLEEMAQADLVAWE